MLYRVLFLLFAGLGAASAAEPAPTLVAPEHRVAPDDPAWQDLRAQFASRPATAVSTFEEQRWFPFKKTPVVLRGEARLAVDHGLSLAYDGPAARVVIIDAQGLLLRENGRDLTPPADVRALAMNGVLLHLVRFDLPALAQDFDLYGERSGATWTLVAVPRSEAVGRVLGQVTVTGEQAHVRGIEMRRAANQRVEIVIAAPHAAGDPFTADELRRYFR